MQGDVALWCLPAAVCERAAEESGTPVVVVDEGCLRRRWEAVGAALDGVELFFPYKSCPLTAVRRRLAAWGAGADVASPEELAAALELGVRPQRILLNQPLRDPAGLARAVEAGATVVADGLDDVRQAAELAAEGHPIRLLLRVNPGVGAPVWSRFGVPVTSPELTAALALAGRAGIEVPGLHAHIGTNVRSAAPYGETARRIAAVWAECEAAYGRPLRCLDFGGGFATAAAQPISVAPGAWDPDPPAVVVARVRDALEQAGLAGRVRLWAEPGRLLAEDAGVLLTRVVATGDGAAGPMVTCDAGVNVLPTAGFLRHRILAVRPPRPQAAESRRVDVFGPLCMQSDVLAVGVPLPADLGVGDLLAIGSVGAYDLAFSFPFIVGRSAVVVRTAAGEFRLARRRETWSDLQHLELPP